MFLLLLGKKRVAAMSNKTKRDARNNSIIRTNLDVMLCDAQFCLVMITITAEGGVGNWIVVGVIEYYVVHRKVGVRLAKDCEI